MPRKRPTRSCPYSADSQAPYRLDHLDGLSGDLRYAPEAMQFLHRQACPLAPHRSTHLPSSTRTFGDDLSRPLGHDWPSVRCPVSFRGTPAHFIQQVLCPRVDGLPGLRKARAESPEWDTYMAEIRERCAPVYAQQAP